MGTCEACGFKGLAVVRRSCDLDVEFVEGPTFTLLGTPAFVAPEAGFRKDLECPPQTIASSMGLREKPKILWARIRWARI